MRVSPAARTFRAAALALVLAFPLASAAAERVAGAAREERVFAFAEERSDYLVLFDREDAAPSATDLRLLEGTGVAILEKATPERARTLAKDPSVIALAPGGATQYRDFGEPALLDGAEPLREDLWALGRIGVDEDAWRLGKGAGIRVAVIDTGVDWRHPDIAPNYDFEASRSFVPDDWNGTALDSDPQDYVGHGTHVAATIAAAENGFGGIGVAPEATIINVKVLSSVLGYGRDEWVLAGVHYAVKQAKADVVSLSLGGYCHPAIPSCKAEMKAWKRITSYAARHGSLVVAALGNDHVALDMEGRVTTHRTLNDPDPNSTAHDEFDLYGWYESPGGLPDVVGVSSTNRETAEGNPLSFGPGRRDQLAYYSNYGPATDIAAPGGARKHNLPRWDGGDTLTGYGVLAATADGSEICESSGFLVEGHCFASIQGTSMATPHVSGVAALVLSARPDLRGQAEMLRMVLEMTARDPLDPNRTPGLDENGYHLKGRAISGLDAYGAGIVDARSAMDWDLGLWSSPRAGAG